MNVLAIKKNVAPEQYLAFERAAERKHEYLNGDIYLRPDANATHSIICVNVSTNLHGQLKDRDSQLYSSDLRVYAPKAKLFAYPDASVVCGQPQMMPNGFDDTLINPTLLIEVLSPSTADYDRGEKFEHYRTIESLREYVMVWQDTKRVMRCTRQQDGSWNLKDFIGENATLDLLSIDCSLSADDIYDKVSFRD